MSNAWQAIKNSLFELGKNEKTGRVDLKTFKRIVPLKEKAKEARQQMIQIPWEGLPPKGALSFDEKTKAKEKQRVG
jgi:hypothetical protein